MSFPVKNARAECQERAGRFFWSVLLLAVVIALLITFSGCGLHTNCQKNRSPELTSAGICSQPERLLSLVEATEEQRLKIEADLYLCKLDLEELRADQAELKHRLSLVLLTDPVNEPELARIRAEIPAIFEQASNRMLDTLLEISKTLKPGQRKALLQTWRKSRILAWTPDSNGRKS